MVRQMFPGETPARVLKCCPRLRLVVLHVYGALVCITRGSLSALGVHGTSHAPGSLGAHQRARDLHFKSDDRGSSMPMPISDPTPCSQSALGARHPHTRSDTASPNHALTASAEPRLCASIAVLEGEQR